MDESWEGCFSWDIFIIYLVVQRVRPPKCECTHLRLKHLFKIIKARLLRLATPSFDADHCILDQLHHQGRHHFLYFVVAHLHVAEDARVLLIIRAAVAAEILEHK